MEDGTIYYISFYSSLIETLGYDPQCALLEVKLTSDGRVRRYTGVPENIWYGLRENYHPDTYFRRFICGKYPEEVISDECMKNSEPWRNGADAELDKSRITGSFYS